MYKKDNFFAGVASPSGERDERHIRRRYQDIAAVDGRRPHWHEKRPARSGLVLSARPEQQCHRRAGCASTMVESRGRGAERASRMRRYPNGEIHRGRQYTADPQRAFA